MTFTMAAPGAALPPDRKPRARLAPLGNFLKDYTSPGVYEIVRAVTADGQWLFVRADDGSWAVGHLPSETEVKAGLGSLPACRAYVGSGQARTDFDRIQAEAEGAGNG